LLYAGQPQVPAKINVPATRSALSAGTHSEVDEMPGLVSEYVQIEETFAPEATEKIAAWILAVQ
jgi:hypothetical protein